MFDQAIEDLTPVERADLARVGITTAATFWAAVDASVTAATATSVPSPPRFLDELARLTALSAPRAKAVVERLANLEADELTGAPVRHLQSLLILGLAVAFLGSAYALRLGPPPPADRVVIARNRTIEPFRTIGPEDVVVANGPTQKGMFAEAGKVVGRYALRRLDAEAAVVATDVSAKAGPALDGLVLLSIAARGLPAEMTDQLPMSVSLVLSPKVQASSQAVRADDVLLLAETRTGDMVTAIVALRPEALAAIQPALGSSDVVLARDLP